MMFIRTENFKTYVTSYPVVSVLILINTLVMIYFIAQGALNHPMIVYTTGGIIPEKIRQGQYWRLFTYAFIHNGMKHFLFNLFFLFLTAPPLEWMLGKIRFILLVFVTTLTTSIVSFFFLNGASVGASGIEFGLLGVYLILLVFHKSLIDSQSRTIIILFIVMGWVMTLLYPNVSVLGHLGGFLGGLLFGWIAIRKANNLNLWHGQQGR